MTDSEPQVRDNGSDGPLGQRTGRRPREDLRRQGWTILSFSLCVSFYIYICISISLSIYLTLSVYYSLSHPIFYLPILIPSRLISSYLAASVFLSSLAYMNSLASPYIPYYLALHHKQIAAFSNPFSHIPLPCLFPLSLP
jgi:hypothetical protein